MKKQVAPRNRTLTVSDYEVVDLEKRFIHIDQPVAVDQIINKTIHGDLLTIIDYLPHNFVDLMIIDPPYNIDKNFHGWKFSQTDDGGYMDYLESWFPKVIQLLKPSGSIYVCCDWKSTAAIYQVMNKYLTVRNRISWQREKGRGAKTNWKNCTEDIWYATVGVDYYFDVDAVKVKRKVIAPYRENGKPKDWEETDEGNFRLTYPSNFWDDITIPFWSMRKTLIIPPRNQRNYLPSLF